MNKSALALLFAALLVAGVMATPRTLQNDNDKAAEAAEHFRILEELEQVHQLRERMLQEGMLHVKHSADKWIVVNQLFEQSVRHGWFSTVALLRIRLVLDFCITCTCCLKRSRLTAEGSPLLQQMYNSNVKGSHASTF